MFATLNRWIAVACIGLAVCLVAFGVYLGGFAWFNDGPTAGLRLFGVSSAFALSLVGMSAAFRWAAAAHARGDERRWFIQVGAIIASYIAFGLAATASSLLDRMPGH